MQTTNAIESNSLKHDENGALLLSAEKLAELLDISIRTLWRLRAGGKLPSPIRLGGSVRWRAQEIEAWIEKGCPNERKTKLRDRA